MAALELQTTLGQFQVDAKMERAWRNRSPVTRSLWFDACVKLGIPTELAGCLYVAAGEISSGGRFAPKEWPDVYWELLAARLPAIIAHMPEKAMNRWPYEEYKRATD